MKHVVIIGGGISGLAAAYYAQQAGGVRVTLLERGARVGGKILSETVDGFVVEGGPDSFISQKPAGMELCRELGLSGELMGANPEHKTTYVVSGGKLHAMPEGMMLMAPTMVLPFLKSRLFSWAGKMRMGMELVLPARKDAEDESLANFVRRRLGREALEKLAGPLLGGIYAADPERMSMESTFPLFPELERKYGSLLKGMLKRKKARTASAAQAKKSGAQTAMFVTLRGGLEQLVSALQERIAAGTIRLNQKIERIEREPDGFKIAIEGEPAIHADDIVFCTPAFVTAELLREVAPRLAEKLNAVRYVTTATVSLGYRLAELEHDLDGYGFIVADGEKRRITACSWSSTKFSHRAPQELALIRAFVGGARAEHLAEQAPAALIAMVREELKATMGIAAEPVLARAYAWRFANPQYDVGHKKRVEEMERLAAETPGIYLAGAALYGPGIPDCIQTSKNAVGRLAAQLENEMMETA